MRLLACVAVVASIGGCAVLNAHPSPQHSVRPTSCVDPPWAMVDGGLALATLAAGVPLTAVGVSKLEGGQGGAAEGWMTAGGGLLLLLGIGALGSAAYGWLSPCPDLGVP